jgi:hypothetical protein
LPRHHEWARCYHRPVLGLTFLVASFLGFQQSPEPATATAQVDGRGLAACVHDSCRLPISRNQTMVSSSFGGGGDDV